MLLWITTKLAWWSLKLALWFTIKGITGATSLLYPLVVSSSSNTNTNTNTMGNSLTSNTKPIQIPVVILSGFHNVPNEWTDGFPLVRPTEGHGMVAVMKSPDANGDIDSWTDDQVIGFASMERTSDTNIRAYIINNIVVSPLFRRKLIGTNLVNALVSRAINDNADQIHISGVASDGARGLLLKCGFQEHTRSTYIKKLPRESLDIPVDGQ